MFRLKTVALAIGMLALTGATSSTASAAPCTTGKGLYKLCINGAAVEEPSTVPAESRATSAMSVDLSRDYEGVFISCETIAGTSSFSTGSGSAVSMTMLDTPKGCKLTGSAKSIIVKRCRIPAEKSFGTLRGTLSSLETVNVRPEVGSAFWEFPFQNNGPETCPATVYGGKSLQGEYQCALHQANVEAVEHELICSTAPGHQVYLGGTEEPTPLSYTQTIVLTGSKKGAKFSIYQAR
ncbi:MAG TPA: hypothetical protein VII01_09460 [Solirubrobacteraceae bacterium]